MGVLEREEEEEERERDFANFNLFLLIENEFLFKVLKQTFFSKLSSVGVFEKKTPAQKTSIIFRLKIPTRL